MFVDIIVMKANSKKKPISILFKRSPFHEIELLGNGDEGSTLYANLRTLGKDVLGAIERRAQVFVASADAETLIIPPADWKNVKLTDDTRIIIVIIPSGIFSKIGNAFKNFYKNFLDITPYIIRKLKSLFRPNIPSQDTNQETTSGSLYSFGGGGNAANAYTPIPIICGVIEAPLKFIARPAGRVTIGQGDNESDYIRILGTWGPGPLQIEDVLIGDVPIEESKADFLAYHGDGIVTPDMPYYTRTNRTEALQSEINASSVPDNDWIAFRTLNNPTEARIDISFPSGLYHSKDDGGKSSTHVDFEYQIRTATRGSISGGRWGTEIKEFRVGYTGRTSINGGGIFSQAVRAILLRFVSLQGNFKKWTTTPFFVSIPFTFDSPDDLPDGVDVRIRRLGIAGQNRNTNQTSLVRFESSRPDNPINLDANYSLFSARILANARLNGSLPTITAKISRKVLNYAAFDPSTNDGAVLEVSSNPAWIYLDLLFGVNQERIVAVPKSSIDWNAFKEWAIFCDRMVDTSTDESGTLVSEKIASFNRIFDGRVTLSKALSDVAAAGYAVTTVRGTLYSVFWEADIKTPIALLTPATTTNFSATRSWTDEVHGYRVSYFDPLNSYKPNQVIAFKDGYSDANATIVKDIDAKRLGASSHVAAWRYGRYKIADDLLHQEHYQVNVNVESLMLEVGDIVSLVDDTIRVGDISGRINGCWAFDMPVGSGNNAIFPSFIRPNGSYLHPPRIQCPSTNKWFFLTAYYVVLLEEPLPLRTDGTSYLPKLQCSPGADTHTITIETANARLATTSFVWDVQNIDSNTIESVPLRNDGQGRFAAFLEDIIAQKLQDTFPNHDDFQRRIILLNNASEMIPSTERNAATGQYSRPPTPTSYWTLPSLRDIAIGDRPEFTISPTASHSIPVIVTDINPDTKGGARLSLEEYKPDALLRSWAGAVPDRNIIFTPDIASPNAPQKPNIREILSGPIHNNNDNVPVSNLFVVFNAIDIGASVANNIVSVVLEYEVNGVWSGGLRLLQQPMILLDVPVGSAYKVRAAFINQAGVQSEYEIVSHTNTNIPDLVSVSPAKPTKLEIEHQGNDTEFRGKGAVIVWADSKLENQNTQVGGLLGIGLGGIDQFFDGYQVQAFSIPTMIGSDLLEKQLFPPITVYQNRFEYNPDIQNITPVRAVKIQVARRSAKRGISEYAELTINNPKPAISASDIAIHVLPGSLQVTISQSILSESDIREVIIWRAVGGVVQEIIARGYQSQFNIVLTISQIDDNYSGSFTIRVAVADTFGGIDSSWNYAEVTHASAIPPDLPPAYVPPVNPTMPVGLTVAPAVNTALLEWTAAAYADHSHTLIFRSGTVSAADRIEIGRTETSLFLDGAIQPNVQYWYWIVHVSKGGVGIERKGPFSNPASASSSPIPNASIGSLSADKITSGTLSTDRIAANSITAAQASFGTAEIFDGIQSRNFVAERKESPNRHWEIGRPQNNWSISPPTSSNYRAGTWWSKRLRNAYNSAGRQIPSVWTMPVLLSAFSSVMDLITARHLSQYEVIFFVGTSGTNPGVSAVSGEGFQLIADGDMQVDAANVTGRLTASEMVSEDYVPNVSGSRLGSEGDNQFDITSENYVDGVSGDRIGSYGDNQVDAGTVFNPLEMPFRGIEFVDYVDPNRGIQVNETANGGRIQYFYGYPPPSGLPDYFNYPASRFYKNPNIVTADFDGIMVFVSVNGPAPAQHGAIPRNYFGSISPEIFVIYKKRIIANQGVSFFARSTNPVLFTSNIGSAAGILFFYLENYGLTTERMVILTNFNRPSTSFYVRKMCFFRNAY